MNRRTLLELFGAAGAVAALSACGSTSTPDERRFANQPTPTASSESGVTPTRVPVRDTVTSAPAISRAALMQVRGAITRIVLLDASECWSIRADGSDVVRFGPGSKQTFTEVAATPDGTSIATIASAGGGGEIVTILDKNGLTIRRVPIPAPKKAQATILTGAGRLAWNAAGDQVLYAKQGGGIDSAGKTGEPTPMVVASQAAVPERVVWSPAADAVAFVSRKSAGASDGLYVGATSSRPVDAAELVKPSAEPRSISQMAWLQDGRRILFTQGAQNANDGLSGDIFEVMASGASAKLLISAGLAAPVSAVGLFAVSPGEEAIAFTVWVPNGTAADFHSLWIKPLATGPAVRIEASVKVAVTGLWWTDTGLVWREQVGTLNPKKTDGAFELRRLTLDGKGAQVFASAPARPATPVASPATGSPAASPVASPAASPTKS